MKRIFSRYCERGIWCIALLLFILLDPHTNRLFSVCPLHLLDIDVCPGCGLGRSVSFLLHGEIMESMRTHILGIPATFFLFLRILTIPPAFRNFTTDQRSIQ